MKSFKKITAILVCIMSAFTMTACKGNEEIKKEEDYSITLGTVFNGREASTLPEEISNYLKLEDESEILPYLKKYSVPFYNDALMFSWDGDGSKKYTVHFALNKDFSDEFTFLTHKEYIFDSAKFVPGNLYYWKVTGSNENSRSPVDSFIYSDKPVRIIDIDNVNNVRDIGGWKTLDGKKIKFGKLIRGGRINNIGETSIEVFNELGIKTELDLRNKHDDGGQCECAFGKDKKYVKISLGQYSYIMPGFDQNEPQRRHYDEETPEKVKAIFELLADESNYPIYFHCNGGADRTGTLAFLLNGMMGVSYEDLCRDFELTSFSSSGRRWRCGISEDGQRTGDVMQDDLSNYVAFDKMYKMMMEGYSRADGSLSSAIENYLVSVCGVTYKEINAIKGILLE